MDPGKSSTPRSVWGFFAFLLCLSTAGVSLGALFSDSETPSLAVADTLVALAATFFSARTLRFALAQLAKELGVRTCR